MAITDWPELERPREKLLQLGPASLSDAELLAIFLRTGVAGKTAVDVARGLLARYGGLRELLAAQGLASVGELNNARLAAVATYHRCVPALTALLTQHDGDLPAFYSAVRTLARDSAARSSLCTSR